MTTELEDAVAELNRDVERGEYSGGGYRYIEADPESLRTVLAALSTPPADDVREALAFHLFAEESTQDEEFTRRVWENHPNEHPVKRLYFDQADAIRATFEVRPRGTVTNADDVRDALIEGVKLDARNLMRSDPRVWHEALESALDETLPGFWAAARGVRS